MKVDLRFSSKINPEFNRLFNDISWSSRQEFNDFITSISKNFQGNLDWWVESPASRNTYASSLFHYFCCAKLIFEIIQDKNCGIDAIYVDSRELKKIIEKILHKSNYEKVAVNYKPFFNLRLKRFVKKYFYYELIFLKRFLRLFIARLSSRIFTSRAPEKPIVLIDTFVSKKYLNDDRWYGSLWDQLNDEQKSEVFFVPTLINTPIKDLFLIFKNLRKNSRNILIKDDFIKINDLLYAYKHKKRVESLKVTPFFLSDIDLSGLVYEDIEYFRDINSIIESLLTYRFIYRIAQLGLNVRLSVDWFEGHSLDKSWNLGIKDFYNNIPRVGYRAFFKSYPYYLSTYPIEIERDAGVLPDIFAVQGKGSIADVKEFLPDLNVMVIPAFKAGHVWERNLGELPNKKNHILVTFPISTSASTRILKALIDAHNLLSTEHKKTIYVLKPHPTNTIKRIKESLNQIIPDTFMFTEERSFPNLLKHSAILITEASSTCLEALAYGISVVIIENPTGITYDPLPENTPKELFKKAKNPKEIKDAITFFLNHTKEQLKKNRSLAMEVRNNYFEPITKDGINRFLNIDNDEK